MIKCLIQKKIAKILFSDSSSVCPSVDNGLLCNWGLRVLNEYRRNLFSIVVFDQALIIKINVVKCYKEY